MTIKRVSQQAESSAAGLSQSCPKLRSGLEPLPVRDETGRVYIELHDHLNLSENQVLLPQDLFFLLQFFDGNHSTLDLRMEYMRKYTDFLYLDRLEEFLQVLDQNFFLKNDTYLHRLQEVNAAYRALPLRQPVCAGSSYAEDPNRLRKELDSFISIPADVDDALRQQQVRACIAPHIDIRAGAAVYGPVYRLLGSCPAADLYVILGIAHQGLNNLFSLTGKDFQTPLGIVRTEQNLVKRINTISAFDFQQEEVLHKSEHSIEFQTVLLKHSVKSDFKILPVLCSFTPELLQQNRPLFERFVNALRSALAEYQGTVCIIAGVDLAHIGIRYGDAQSPTPTLLAQVERNDRELLQALADADYQQFQNLMISSNDRFRVCGYAALTTLLSLHPLPQGRLLAYSSAVMDKQRSTVTFAGMVF